MTQEEIVAFLNAKIPEQFPGLLGYRTTAINEARLDGELTITKPLLQPMGLAHGGVALSMMDTLTSMYIVGAHLVIGKMPSFVTTEMSSYFLGAGKEGDRFTGHTQLIRWGKSSAVMDCLVYKNGDEADLIAKSTLAFKLFDAPSKDDLAQLNGN